MQPLLGPAKFRGPLSLQVTVLVSVSSVMDEHKLADDKHGSNRAWWHKQGEPQSLVMMTVFTNESTNGVS